MRKKKREPHYEIYLKDRIVWRGDNLVSAYKKFCKKYPERDLSISWNWAQLKGITLIAKISL